MRFDEELARSDVFYDRTGRSHRRGGSKKKPPEWELRVPLMPKTRTKDWTKPPTRLPYRPTDEELKPTPLPNKGKQPEITLYSGEERRRTTTDSTEATPVKNYQTTVGGWSSTPAKKEAAQKKPPESELRIPPMPEIKVEDRAVDTTQAKKKQIANDAPTDDAQTDPHTSFTGGGRSFSDPAPKSPESELRISSTPQTKATAEIPATTKTYDWDNPTLERSSERASRSTQRSDYSVDSDRRFTGGGRDFSDPEPQFSLGTYAKNFGQAALNGLNNTFYGIGSAVEDYVVAPIIEAGGDIAQASAIAFGADPQGEWGKEAADAVRFMRRGKEFTERQQQAVSQEAEENIGRIKNKTAREIATFAQNDVAPSTLTSAIQAAEAIYSGGMSLLPTTQSLTQAAYLAQNPTLVNKVTAWLSKQFGSPNYWISFGQEYVGEYDRAIADGETPEKAALVAANTATLNALVENSGGYQTLPSDVEDIASRSGKRGLHKWIKAILDEGYEEVVQDIISRTVEKIGYRSETPLFSTTDGKAIINPSRLLRDFLGGAAVASIIAGGETAVNNAVNGAQVSNILPQTDAETTASSTQTVANAESGVYNGVAALENLTPQEQVAMAADTLGEAGKAVLVRQFNSKSDATQYTLGMTAIYEAGKSSVTKEPLTLTREAKDAMSSITLPQHEAIFEAGVKDAKQELASGVSTGKHQYTAQQSDSATDQAMFEAYQDLLGENAPATFEEFEDLKNGDDWSAFQAYGRAIESGELTPLADFNLYKSISAEIDSTIVGKMTSNGIMITNKSEHFISRTIGSIWERRNGVTLKDVVDALTNPERVGPIRESSNGRSQRFDGKNCYVAINPDTGMLIQTNPHKKGENKNAQVE